MGRSSAHWPGTGTQSLSPPARLAACASPQHVCPLPPCAVSSVWKLSASFALPQPASLPSERLSAAPPPGQTPPYRFLTACLFHTACCPIWGASMGHLSMPDSLQGYGVFCPSFPHKYPGSEAKGEWCLLNKFQQFSLFYPECSAG